MNPIGNKSYLDAGFDRFLSRNHQVRQESLSTMQFEGFTDSLSATKVQGGRMTTTDGQTELNLEQGFFRISQAQVQLVRFGRQEDGNVGVVINDQEGRPIMVFSGQQGLLASGNGVTEQDFVEGTFKVKDDDGKTVVFLGKQIGGF